MTAGLEPTRQLKPHCLGFSELLANAVALISPTMTAALIIPVMFSNTGDWSWLSYALGTTMLLFVAYNLNQFARRSASSGSMYAYISQGLGLTAGGVGGWALIWAYLGIAMAGVTGFAVFSGILLSMVGLSLPPWVLFAVCVVVAWSCAWRNVQLSAVMMLTCEGVSMALIAVLCLVLVARHGFVPDAAQFAVARLPWSNLGLGVVVAIFSLVGFEAATAFGDEARDPLRNVPRSVYASLAISGIFFVFVTYVTVQATRGFATPLDKIDQPLNVLARLAGMPVLMVPLSLGAMLSFFALCLSCISAGGRIVYAMGRHGLFPAITGASHGRNETPHIAVTIMAILALAVPSIACAEDVALLDLFNYVGTCAAFGFMVAYTLITVAAPIYLKRLGQLRTRDLFGSALSLLMLTIPVVGSVYPVPNSPVSYFPYVFLAYLAVAIVWVVSYHRRQPSASERIRRDLDLTHSRFAVVEAAVPAGE